MNSNLINMLTGLLSNQNTQNLNEQQDKSNFSNSSNNNNVFSQSINKENSNIKNQNVPTSDYPDVFFTGNTNIQPNNSNSFNTFNNVTDNNASNYSSPMQNFSSLLNFDMLKNLLPMFTKKSSKMDITNLLNGLNPQITSLFSTLGMNAKKDRKQEDSKQNSIIDISEYTEVS